MNKIIFVDSQRDRLEPLRRILGEEDYNVQTYTDGNAALSAIQRMQVDLVLINLPTAKIDSLTLLDRIRVNFVAPVVMLSAVRDEIEEIMSLRLGADDYIHGPVSPRLLSEKIKGLMRRQAALLTHAETFVAAEKALNCGDLSMDPARHEVVWKNHALTMTMTEFQILLALARRPGVVKSRDQLVSASYSDDGYVDSRTIDCHIKRIRRKLRAVDPDFTSIETLYGIGYRFNAPNGRVHEMPEPEAIKAKLGFANDDAKSGPTYVRSMPSPREPLRPALQRINETLQTIAPLARLGQATPPATLVAGEH